MKRKILIVEDNGVPLLHLQRNIEKLGYSVAGTAASGEEAIVKAQETGPDLILMDIVLNGKLNGIEAAVEIKKRIDIPVIYTTAHSDRGTIEQSKISDPAGYLIKPYSNRDLLVAVEIALNRHELNIQLKESEVKYQSLFEESKDAICIRDRDGRFIDVNRRMIELFGYDRDEMNEMSIEDLFVNSDDIYEFDKEMREKDYMRDFEVKLRRKDGNELFCIVTSNALSSNNGSVKRYQVIIRDITEKKQLEGEKENSVEKLRKAMNGIIQAMALTVEVRDPYTAGHQKRVANLARAIADEMGLPNDSIEGIRMAGVIHDLGKINVPSEILSKPGRLNDFEFSLIKSHPRVGFDILKNIEFPYPIAQIVDQHHERIDGSGYPEGLSGEDILIEARIIGVADVVEAMASHRPYRPALGIDTALDEITKNRGVLYDPDVVDVCNMVFNVEDLKFEDIFDAAPKIEKVI